MTREEFDDLMVLIEAMLDMRGAHDTSDGGLIEAVRLSELKKEFIEKHVA